MEDHDAATGGGEVTERMNERYRGDRWDQVLNILFYLTFDFI